ncbi:MAG: TolC family protein [Prolixibacteraceae bacterium]|jgi:outer membrane protein|nr:TolC family protein [Prolixibacteraceae bacterium]
MIRTIFTLAYLLLLALFASLHAQELWTLDKCINYAHDNNIQIKQSTLNTQYQLNMLKEKKNSRLPNLNGQVSENLNFGRSLTYENTYQNVNSSQTDFGLGTQLTVFQGMQINNAVKKTEFDLKASFEDLAKAKDDLSLNIASTFLEILFAKELVKVSEDQILITNQQLKQSQEKVNAGSLASGALLEIEAQAAREELNIVDAKNQLQLAKLKLAQMLELVFTDKFDVEIPILPEVGAQSSVTNSQDVYLTALKQRPEIRGAEYRYQSTEMQLKMAEGVFYPTISFYANYYNNYNNKYKDITGTSISFGDQLSNNQRKGLGLQMNIPIFNRFFTKLQVDNAKIQMLNTQLDLEGTKKVLRQEIETAQTTAITSFNRFKSTEKAVSSMQEAFRYSEEKFNVGMVNAVDYNLAKTNLLKASSDLLRAKYEFIFRSKILDFYRGIPITL